MPGAECTSTGGHMFPELKTRLWNTSNSAVVQAWVAQSVRSDDSGRLPSRWDLRRQGTDVRRYGRGSDARRGAALTAGQGDGLRYGPDGTYSVEHICRKYIHQFTSALGSMTCTFLGEGRHWPADGAAV